MLLMRLRVFCIGHFSLLFSCYPIGTHTMCNEIKIENKWRNGCNMLLMAKIRRVLLGIIGETERLRDRVTTKNNTSKTVAHTTK